jgi:hypothetical protein
MPDAGRGACALPASVVGASWFPDIKHAVRKKVGNIDAAIMQVVFLDCDVTEMTRFHIFGVLIKTMVLIDPDHG